MMWPVPFAKAPTEWSTYARWADYERELGASIADAASWCARHATGAGLGADGEVDDPALEQLYRDADAALLVFDITDSDSFKRIQGWVRELRKMVGPEILLTIAGNKLDLARQRVVSQQEAQAYAESCGALYHETSAKLGKGFDDVFGSLGKRLLQQRAQKRPGGAGTPGAAAAEGEAAVDVKFNSPPYGGALQVTPSGEARKLLDQHQH